MSHIPLTTFPRPAGHSLINHRAGGPKNRNIFTLGRKNNVIAPGAGPAPIAIQADLQANSPPSRCPAGSPGPVSPLLHSSLSRTLFTAPPLRPLPTPRTPFSRRRCVVGGWVEWGCGEGRGGWRGQAQAPRSCLGPVNGGGGWRRPPFLGSFLPSPLGPSPAVRRASRARDGRSPNAKRRRCTTTSVSTTRAHVWVNTRFSRYTGGPTCAGKSLPTRPHGLLSPRNSSHSTFFTSPTETATKLSYRCGCVCAESGQSESRNL